jgi:hypothetical protein
LESVLALLTATEALQVFFAAMAAVVEGLILFVLLVLERGKAEAAIAQATFLTGAAGTTFFASGKLALTTAQVGEKTLMVPAIQFAGFQGAQFFQAFLNFVGDAITIGVF